MSSVKKYTHKSHYLNFPVLKCPSTYLTLNLLSPNKLIQQETYVFHFNPSTLKSDWLLISPHSISHESNVEVTRIKEMITNLRLVADCQTNSPCQYHKECKETSVENMNTNVLGC